jgi:D-3-phosphoglycerate dehydrogenase
MKIVQIDEFEIDVPIATHMAFIKYKDRPGVVAVLGRIFGDANINIGGMQVARDEKGGLAMVALTVDSAVSNETAQQISSEIQGHTGRVVSFTV